MPSTPSRQDDNDFQPLAFGAVNQHATEDGFQVAPSDVLQDFSAWWGAEAAAAQQENMQASPVGLKETFVKESPLRRSTSSHPPPSETTTHVSETSSLHRGSTVSWTSSTNNKGTADDFMSAVSNETDDASRSSVKRRRTANASNGFQPLLPVREDDKGVRPWMVEVRDHDVVLGTSSLGPCQRRYFSITVTHKLVSFLLYFSLFLSLPLSLPGDTHEPTWGTKIYREVRKPYAKKTLDNEQLKLVKTEFQRRLEKEIGHKLKGPPTFWCNKENTSKIKQATVAGCLKNRPGIAYAYAKDQAIKDDIKNASARSRTRSTKVFTVKGFLSEAMKTAMSTVEEWVGDDVDKELYAKNFREDLKRLVPWHGHHVAKKNEAETLAHAEPDMKGTHMREARIHDTHVSHLETVMVDMINQLGNLMVDSHRSSAKKSNDGPGTVKSSGSVDESASYASSKEPTASFRSRPPLGIRSVPERSTSFSRRVGIASRPRTTLRRSREDEHGNHTIASSTFSALSHNTSDHADDNGNGGGDMDVSPISVRKAMLTENLGQTFIMQPDSADVNKKNLEHMFTTLRMGSDVPREVDRGALDELSVLSMPDDVTVLLEARELAIRRGIDQPAALPRAGHVADRTKALMQQLGPKEKK